MATPHPGTDDRAQRLTPSRVQLSSQGGLAPVDACRYANLILLLLFTRAVGKDKNRSCYPELRMHVYININFILYFNYLLLLLYFKLVLRNVYILRLNNHSKS